MKTKYRQYGKGPSKVIVVHGGPGGIGGMTPVATELAKTYDVLEPLETETTIEGQINELKTVLDEQAELPVVLIGHSWGAWLVILFASKYPSYVKKLILVSTPPLDDKYAATIASTRLERLDQGDKETVDTIVKILHDPLSQNSDMKPFIKFITAVDSYQPAYYEAGQFLDVDIFRKVWAEAAQIRTSGKLLKACAKIHCPVTVIHGDYDPHPFTGVKEPLSAIMKEVTYVLLKNCGHTPWVEKEARDLFYEILKRELMCCFSRTYCGNS